MPSTGPTFVGTATASARQLARSLGASTVLEAPEAGDDHGWSWSGARFDALEPWRRELGEVAAAVGVVVCTWSAPAASAGLLAMASIEPDGWRSGLEWPTALWFTTLVAAAERCADGGSLVAVVERPTTLDAEGRAMAVAVADGVINLVRSLAAVHGPRGVRVNAVETTLHSVAEQMLGPPPPLATFPGRVEVEVAGAVRLLLSPDAVGLTGTVLDAGCGR
ncbi:hypothetical protein BH10ACT1_BH10ACT1_24160 [soil metagenome]